MLSMAEFSPLLECYIVYFISLVFFYTQCDWDVYCETWQILPDYIPKIREQFTPRVLTLNGIAWRAESRPSPHVPRWFIFCKGKQNLYFIKQKQKQGHKNFSETLIRLENTSMCPSLSVQGIPYASHNSAPAMTHSPQSSPPNKI